MPLQVTYTLTVEEEQIPIEGNVSAIDPETDKAQERWVRDQLNAGNGFAWCWARVVATCNGFEGEDSLGGCSYESREAFERDLLPEMKRNALEDLRSKLAAQIANVNRDAAEIRKRADNARIVLAGLPKRVKS